MDLFKLCVMIALIVLLLILLGVEIVTGGHLTRPTAMLPTPVQTKPAATPSAVPRQTVSVAVETPSGNRVALTGASLPAGVLTLVGAGAPNVEIEIVDNGQIVGVVQAGADGQWRFTYTPGGGDHELSARIKGMPETASSPFKVTVMTATPSLPPDGRCIGPAGRIEGNIYVVGVCDTLTQIGRRTGISVKALIAANPQITDTNRIWVGQPVWLPR